MKPPLQPPDSLHLQAAEGWVGLGDLLAANEELEKITPQLRAHPEVLKLRWHIYAHAKKWDACLDIATALTTMTPERRFGWVHRAHSLDKLGHTQIEAGTCPATRRQILSSWATSTRASRSAATAKP